MPAHKRMRRPKLGFVTSGRALTTRGEGIVYGLFIGGSTIQDIAEMMDMSSNGVRGVLERVDAIVHGRKTIQKLQLRKAKKEASASRAASETDASDKPKKLDFVGSGGALTEREQGLVYGLHIGGHSMDDIAVMMGLRSDRVTRVIASMDRILYRRKSSRTPQASAARADDGVSEDSDCDGASLSDSEDDEVEGHLMLHESTVGNGSTEENDDDDEVRTPAHCAEPETEDPTRLEVEAWRSATSFEPHTPGAARGRNTSVAAATTSEPVVASMSTGELREWLGSHNLSQAVLDHVQAHEYSGSIFLADGFIEEEFTTERFNKWHVQKLLELRNNNRSVPV